MTTPPKRPPDEPFKIRAASVPPKTSAARISGVEPGNSISQKLSRQTFDNAARNDWQHVNKHKLILMKYIRPMGKAPQREDLRWGVGSVAKEWKRKIFVAPFSTL